jgi:hypothetical protein
MPAVIDCGENGWKISAGAVDPGEPDEISKRGGFEVIA